MGFVGNYLKNLCGLCLGREPVRPLMFSFDQAISEGGVGNCKTGRLLMNIDIRGNVARCTERLDDPVGNILTDDIDTIRNRLWHLADSQQCAQCWTSCRGFAESMQMRPRLRQYREFLHSVKPH